MSDEQQREDGWSSVPPREHGHQDLHTDGREARHVPAAAAAGPAHGRVHGRPAPQYGEYAPDGWVNPVLAEEERQARLAREREASQRTEQPGARPTTRAGADARGARAGRDGAAVVPSSRFGASPLDFVMTVALLVLGLFSVVQSLSIGAVASAVRQTFEQQYTTLADPGALTSAAIVSAVAGVVVFALVVWWSFRRLRARRWTFWVPLLGGAVSTVISVGAFITVLLQDEGFVRAVLQQTGN